MKFIIFLSDKNQLQGQYGIEKFSEHSLTDHFSKPFFDTESDLRCEFHNSDLACDKQSCTKKNAMKYFYLLINVLADFFPDLKLETGKHVFIRPTGSKRPIKRLQATAPANTPNNKSAEPAASYHQQTNEAEVMSPTPRRPNQESYSSRNKSCGMINGQSSPRSSNGSASPTSNGLSTDSIPEIPRRPNTPLKKTDGKAKTYTKARTYQDLSKT